MSQDLLDIQYVGRKNHENADSRIRIRILLDGQILFTVFGRLDPDPYFCLSVGSVIIFFSSFFLVGGGQIWLFVDARKRIRIF